MVDLDYANARLRAMRSRLLSAEDYAGLVGVDSMARLVSAMATVHPGFPRAVQFSKLLRVPAAMPRFDVGRYREIARFERVQADQRRRGRRLYFAGDYLMDPSRSGALASAERAADAVAEDLEL